MNEPPPPENSNHHTFICIDCGDEVHQFVRTHVNDQDICYTCLWIRGVPEADRPALREFLKNKT